MRKPFRRKPFGLQARFQMRERQRHVQADITATQQANEEFSKLTQKTITAVVVAALEEEVARLQNELDRATTGSLNYSNFARN